MHVFRQLMRRRLRNIKNTNRKEEKHRYGPLVHPRAHGPTNGRIRIASALRIPGGVFWSFGVLVPMFCPASKTKQSWTSQKLHEVTECYRLSTAVMTSPMHVKPPTRHQLGSLCSLHRKAADGKATQEPIVLAFSGSPVLSQIVTLFFGGKHPQFWIFSSSDKERDWS